MSLHNKIILNPWESRIVAKLLQVHPGSRRQQLPLRIRLIVNQIHLKTNPKSLSEYTVLMCLRKFMPDRQYKTNFTELNDTFEWLIDMHYNRLIPSSILDSKKVGLFWTFRGFS
jgi:hypothetical protein